MCIHQSFNTQPKKEPFENLPVASAPECIACKRSWPSGRPRRDWGREWGDNSRLAWRRGNWVKMERKWALAVATDATRRRINRVKNVKEKSILTPQQKVAVNWQCVKTR